MIRNCFILPVVLAVLGLASLNVVRAQDVFQCAADKWKAGDYAAFLNSTGDEVVDQGFLDAVVQEGIIDFYGLRKSPPNPERAIDLFTKATEANYAPAQNILGTLHLTGWGIAQPSSKASRNYFELAAAQQYPPAQNNLAVLFWNGWGTERNVARAEELFESASGRGYAPAQSNVGLILKTRGGDTWGGSKAIEMFRAAQAKDFGPAAFNYATYYLEGKGVERDYGVAANSLKMAAKAGDPWAQYNLGQMAALGIGIEQDFLDAFRWLKLSRMGGVSYAAKQLEIIRGFLTKEEIGNAEVVIEMMESVRWNDVLGPASNEDIGLSAYDLMSLAPELIASRVKCAESMEVDIPSTWATSFQWNE